MPDEHTGVQLIVIHERSSSDAEQELTRKEMQGSAGEDGHGTTRVAVEGAQVRRVHCEGSI